MIFLSFKAFYYPAQENNTYSSHFHNEFEFVLPMQNYSLRTETGDIVVSYGELLFLRANTLHHQMEDGHPCPRYVLHIEKPTIESLSTPNINLLKILETTPTCHVDIRGYEGEFIQILSSLSNQHSLTEKNELNISIALLRFLEMFIERLEFKSIGVEASQRFSASNSGINIVHATQQLIIQNLDKPLTLDFIADQVHVSKYYLSHLFSKLTGYSLKEYITHCRLVQACEKLREGASVEEAQDLLNIKNKTYFIRLFKKEVGCTPSEYFKRYSKKLVTKAPTNE